MNQRLAFDRPVVVWLQPGRPNEGVRRIGNVNDGLAALHRYGIGRLKDGRIPCWEWRDAYSALSLARELVTPDTITAARTALCRAAQRAGALADPEPVPAPIALLRLCERGEAA